MTEKFDDGQPGIYGVRVDWRGQGRNMQVGKWDKAKHGGDMEKDPQNPFSGRMFNAWQKVINQVLQPTDQEYERRYLARVGNKPLELSEPRIRRAQVSEKQKIVESARAEMEKVLRNVDELSMTLKPFDYENNAHSAQINAELRTLLRTSDNRQRHELMKQSAMQAAALQAPGALSGMSDDALELMRARLTAERYPQETARIRQANAAAELLGTTLRAAEASLSSEDQDLGPALVETKPAKAWA